MSAATARVLTRGHRWVLPDRQTGSLRAVRAGDLVDLVDPAGEPIALALADPGSRVVARVVDRPGGHFDPVQRALAALDRRAPLGLGGDTDVYRLVHGEADGLPGLFVDRYGPALLAVRHARCTEPWCAAVYDTLLQQADLDQLWEKDHFDDLRRSGVSGRAARGDLGAGDRWTVHERGIGFEVGPCGGLATGLYPDQRSNRDELRRLGPFGRALNLFSYTGAFSVALLAAGAGNVVDVDLSAAAIRIARRNLELNGLPTDRYTAVCGDALAHVRSAGNASFDLVVIDPPTSARGGRGWDARRGYPELLDEVLRILAPGGTILACLNRRRGAGDRLRRIVSERIRHGGRKVIELRDAPPAPDYPVVRGFEESRSFQGVRATIR